MNGGAAHKSLRRGPEYPLLSTQDGKMGLFIYNFEWDYGCLWDYQWIHDGRIGRYG
jgi:hypothetical protein